MNRKILIIVLAAALVVSLMGILILYFSERHQQESSQTEEREQAKRIEEAMAPIPQSGATQVIDVKLYFRAASPASGAPSLLTPEIRRIGLFPEKDAFLRRLMEVLAGGPGTDAYPTIPKGTTVRQVFIVDDLAVVDFSGEISTRHPGGALEELATIYSIVNTITENVPGIHSVRILVDGSERSTLAGHVSLQRHFTHSSQYVTGVKSGADIIHEENLP